MNFLQGYGSGGEESGSDPGSNPKLIQAGEFLPEHAGAGLSQANGVEGLGRDIFHSTNNTANGVHTDVLSSIEALPKPKNRIRRPAKFKLPILTAPDSDSEDDRPLKKAKMTSKGMGIKDFLPPPVNRDESSGQVPVLGGGAAMGLSRRMGEDSDEEMTGKTPYQDEVVLGPANEAYRIFDDPNDMPTNSGHDHENGDEAVTMSYDAYSRQEQGGNVGAMGDSLLAQALQEEAAKAMKDGSLQNPLAGVQFKEINQQNLTYMAPEQKQAKNALRTAFGADHEARVREEAGPKPEKRARSKHQITSLFHQAKMKEMEFVEMKGQAVKTKRETQAKYGWS